MISMISIKIIVLSLLLVNNETLPSSAIITCDDSWQCKIKISSNSHCERGVCTNPFEKGCLNLRVCNSDDPPNAPELGLCKLPEIIEYPEVRVSAANWETAIFASWVVQIMLEEIMGVPSTIDSIGVDGSMSFYEKFNNFGFSNVTWNWDALYEARDVVDCRLSMKGTCSHVIPELWAGQKRAIKQAQADNVIGQESSLDALGDNHWFIPKFTLDTYPEFFSYHGMKGEKNRQKLANLFKRPTTWLKYCEEFSPTKCNEEENDTTASRWPEPHEENKFFVEGLYDGFFRYTKESNCRVLAHNCTGEFIQGTCHNSNSDESILYWEQIALSANGPNEYGTYGYSDIFEIWAAANKTKNHVVIQMWTPHDIIQGYVGTEAEFIPVQLPQVTKECIENRVSNEDRCSMDPIVRAGPKEAACGYEKQVLKKAVTEVLKCDKSDTDCSPAYEFIKNLKIDDVDQLELLNNWIDVGAVDKYGYGPRLAVCNWVKQNLESTLRNFIPHSYPRKVLKPHEHKHSTLCKFSRVLAILTLILVSLLSSTTCFLRHEAVIVRTQPELMYVMEAGLLFVAIGSIVYEMNPTKITCVSRTSIVDLGYTMVLVPIIQKATAINKRQHEKISRKKLFGYLALCTCVVLIYSICSLVLNPSVVETTKALIKEDSIIMIQKRCPQNQWLVSVIWNSLLLVWAMVLVFQIQTVKHENNDTQKLGFVVISNFIFLMLRIITLVFQPSDSPPMKISAVASILMSNDVLTTTSIYVAPKIYAAMKVKTSIRRKNNKRGDDEYCSTSIAENSCSSASIVCSVCNGTGKRLSSVKRKSMIKREKKENIPSIEVSIPVDSSRNIVDNFSQFSAN